MCNRANSGASGSSIARPTGSLKHRTWQQRGGYNGYRIPDDRFRGSFGSGHAFRIHSYPLVLFGGYPSFQYGAFGSASLTRRQSTGEPIGTTPTMFTSTIPGTAITCTTAGILRIGLQLRSI